MPAVQSIQRPYDTYFGGKSGAGVYQAIINEIPKHEVFVSVYAGNCGVVGHKLPAEYNIVIDVDPDVSQKWQGRPGVISYNCDGIWKVQQLFSEFILTKKILVASQFFAFLDPPYLSEVRTGNGQYRYPMNDRASHKNMLSAAILFPFPCLITHYPCELYDEMLKNWRKVDIKGRTQRGLKTERLYMNYPPATCLHDYRYFGNNFRQRELFKKRVKNMVNGFAELDEKERNGLLFFLRRAGFI